MRILFFSRDYTVHDHRFLAALAKTEHKVYFLRLERGGGQGESRPLPPGIEQVLWSGGQTPAALQDGPRLLLELRRVLRRTQPDLVLAGPLQRSAFLAALSGFRPLVSMTWGYDLIRDARRGPAWAWATRFTLKRSAALVGDSDTLRQLAIAYGMPPERIVTFPWGIDLSHFSPGGRLPAGAQPPGSEPAGFNLLSVRNWEPIYGIDLIARAFVQAARQRPELRLVMLGGGSQSGLLRQIFAQGGVEERVSFPGSVQQAELPRFYRRADLYLSASHSDGSSISLLEALGCGCPALVSDIPGNREWVQPGVQGWLFPDGDAGALAAGILRAVDCRRDLADMGQSARRLAEQRADWNKNFPKLFEAFEVGLKAQAQ